MTSKTVLVTGASGYIGKHVVVALLRAGHKVRGSVRSPDQGNAVAATAARHLGDLPAGRLSAPILDLGSDRGWDEALAGADALVHTASPFPFTQPRDADEIIRPAVDGTLRALAAAEASGVKRVVLTSSVVAVMYGGFPQARASYSEADWTDGDDTRLTAYARSKTLAERAAWRFVKDHPGMGLTTINPSLVLGTPLDDRYGTSLQVVERLIASKDPALPDLTFGIVNVADVATAHVRALERPETAGQRFICSNGERSFVDMARVIARALPDRRIVTRRAPNLLIRTLGYFDRSIGTILPDLGRHPRYDNSAARQALGIEFKGADDTIMETARFLAGRNAA